MEYSIWRTKDRPFGLWAVISPLPRICNGAGRLGLNPWYFGTFGETGLITIGWFPSRKATWPFPPVGTSPRSNSPIFSKKEPFFDSGHVYKFFYDGFVLMWQQGLESSVRNLKYLHPDYDVWVIPSLFSLQRRFRSWATRWEELSPPSVLPSWWNSG